MISAELSSKVLFIGTDPDGRGGIATVLQTSSSVVERFRYVCSHRTAGRMVQAWLALTAVFKTAWLCAFGGIEIVHIHTASYRAFFRESLYLLIAKLFRKRVVLQLHGGEFELFYKIHPRYCRYICRKADVLLGVSNYFGDMFRRLELNDNVAVLYNAVPKPLYGRAERGDKVRVLFMGAIDDNKGIFDVLECFSRNRERLESVVTLDICGLGDEERLRHVIESGGLCGFVTYRGWVDMEQKNRLLSVTDIYIQPSYFESFGIAVVEAMSYGIPVIASDAGGIPEIVKSGDNGFLIPPGDMRRFLDSLLRLAESPVLREEMGRKALVTASAFTVENMERRLTEIYKSLLA